MFTVYWRRLLYWIVKEWNLQMSEKVIILSMKELLNVSKIFRNIPKGI